MSTAQSATKAHENLKDKKRALYRDAVLDAAEQVFGELGYEATKVQRIAAAAGISLTTLYSVFDSKWEIYRAVNRRRLTEVMSLAHGILDDDAASIDTLIAGMRMQLSFFMKRRDFLRMQLKEVTAWSTIELLRSPEQIEALGAGLKLFADMFRRCIDDGYFIDDDPDLMSRIAIASQQVRLATWMDRGAEEDPRVVSDAAVRHVLRSYCRPERLQEVLGTAGLESMS
ncbi:MAG: TetR/AcrR family transcriptional regulator [Polyangiales bacterium]